MEFDWLKTIPAREKLPNVHVVQWLGMFWFWTLFSRYVMECKLFGACVVSKGAEKTRFNLKI